MDHSSPETPGRPTLDEETLDRIIAYRATDRPFYSLDAGELDLLLRLADAAPMRWILGSEEPPADAAAWSAARAGFLPVSELNAKMRPDLVRGTCRHCGAEIHRYANAVNWNHSGPRVGGSDPGSLHYHAAEPEEWRASDDPHPVCTCVRLVRDPVAPYGTRHERGCVFA